MIDRMGVVAGNAVEITPLKKDDQAIARPIYTGKIEYSTHERTFFHYAALLINWLRFHAHNSWRPI